nr:hypothetical protein CFP56_00334 [Quercus suber]
MRWRSETSYLPLPRPGIAVQSNTAGVAGFDSRHVAEALAAGLGNRSTPKWPHRGEKRHHAGHPLPITAYSHHMASGLSSIDSL